MDNCEPNSKRSCSQRRVQSSRLGAVQWKMSILRGRRSSIHENRESSQKAQSDRGVYCHQQNT